MSVVQQGKLSEMFSVCAGESLHASCSSMVYIRAGIMDLEAHATLFSTEAAHTLYNTLLGIIATHTHMHECIHIHAHTNAHTVQ